MDDTDGYVDEDAHVLTMKHPIEHADIDSGMYEAEFAGNDALGAVFPSIVGGYNMPGIMVGMEVHESDYDSSWLSNELQVDPIIDEAYGDDEEQVSSCCVPRISRLLEKCVVCNVLAR